MGEEGGIWDEFVEEEGEEKKRRSKDKKITGEGRKLCKMLEEEGRGRLKWNKKEKNLFEEGFRRKKEGEKKKEGKWNDLCEWIREVKNEVRREVNNKEGERKEKAVEDWWDKECRRSKRKVKEELEKWREGRGSWNKYKKSKKEYKKLCDRKKEEEKKKWEKEVEQTKTEEDVWKIVNKGRKGRRGVDEKIEIRE
ncbi:hypothetical protein PUN28_020795 [Cardiocondyla obscurior]|uniref:Uncharacterized protein n=1 Tax=Cardiocondyla obscurior TaxID=286306 RepID=A0AAW2E9C7_9HYME